MQWRVCTHCNRCTPMIAGVDTWQHNQHMYKCCPLLSWCTARFADNNKSVALTSADSGGGMTDVTVTSTTDSVGTVSSSANNTVWVCITVVLSEHRMLDLGCSAMSMKNAVHWQHALLGVLSCICTWVYVRWLSKNYVICYVWYVGYYF